MAVDRRSKRLGHARPSSRAAARLPRHAAVVPAGRAGRRLPGRRSTRAKTRDGLHPARRVAASSTPTAECSPTTSASSRSPSTGRVIRNRPRDASRRCSSGCPGRSTGAAARISRRRYDSNLYDPLLPLPLKEDVDEATVNFLLERMRGLPRRRRDRAVASASIRTRRSPAHVVGYMGALNENNVDDYMARGYNRNERVGAFGVELSMEEYLHGRWGSQVWEIDAAGNIVRADRRDARRSPAWTCSSASTSTSSSTPSRRSRQQLRNRRDLPTSSSRATAIDPNERLDPKSAETSAFYEDFPEWVPYKAPAGAVVVLNHSNGQVVAMASYPTFDNRWFNSGIDKDEVRLSCSRRRDDPDKSILVNRAVQGRYNLGSSIKPFIAWSAMHSGIIGADELYRRRGHLQADDDRRRRRARAACAASSRTRSTRSATPSRYGPVDVEDALAGQLRRVLLPARRAVLSRRPASASELKTDLEQFGFGADSGIDLPYEWDGRIPDDAIKKDAGRARRARPRARRDELRRR